MSDDRNSYRPFSLAEVHEKVGRHDDRFEDLKGLDASHVKFLTGNGRPSAEVRVDRLERDVKRMLATAIALALASLPAIVDTIAMLFKHVLGGH